MPCRMMVRPVRSTCAVMNNESSSSSAKSKAKADVASSKKQAPKPAKPVKPKTSKTEAAQGIAAALQQAETATSAIATATAPVPAKLQIGMRVKVSEQAVFEGTQTALERYKGREGTLSKQINPTCWEVTFKGAGGGKRDFFDHDLQIVSQA